MTTPAVRISVITFNGTGGLVPAAGVQAGDTVLQVIEIGVGGGAARNDVTGFVLPVVPANNQIAISNTPAAGVVAVALFQPHA